MEIIAMKSYLKFIALLLIGQSLYGAASIEEVIKDTFYVGKLSQKPKLTFVMERLSDENIKDWLHYATEQMNRVWGVAEAPLAYMNLPATGSGYFKKVLEKTSYKENEVWIAYITTELTPVYNPKKFTDYSYTCPLEIALSYSCKTAALLEMFVTVTSNPTALLTSHMGISKTTESAVKGNEHKGISMDLHSFGAAVMVLRDKNRRFMITSPVHAMERIIAKNLPRSAVFVGEKNEMTDLLSRRNATLQDMIADTNIHNPYQKALASIQEKAQKKLEWYIQNNSEETLRKFKKDTDAQRYLEYNGHTFETSPDKLKKYSDSELKYELDWLLESYKFPADWTVFMYKVLFPQEEYERPLKKKIIDTFYNFIEQHPGIVQMNNRESFTVYDPLDTSKVLVHFSKDIPLYNWIFSGPLDPAPGTHYVVIDIQALADFSFKQ
jgi:hypothetical protein